MDQQVVIAEGPLANLKASRSLLEREGLDASLVRPPGCEPGG